MTERNLFFNRIWWSSFLGNEQSVAYLEELWRRAGGGGVPDQNLDQVVNEVTNIDQSVTEGGGGTSLHQARQLAEQMAVEAVDDTHMASGLKKLSSAISNAIDELTAERFVMAMNMKKLEHRISQLEDAQ